ncbi:CBS domain protein [Archaeoglobus sulfaticallidus PM70-1]|uniref:CBS domain protein n=1 Tax=Archaeoglobus sulfaticallidus PM70-1 TaxID=387631 RepID=N0BBY4_9EURY|nr:CBS domain-containing protein [Archaeoglobus sulfaticallidus]AGK61129.1 CBS domain protein [Archaeoglobus sulfaticallidus PM70-1]
MRAEDVMNRDVVYITLPNTRDVAINIFKKHKISGIPVVKNDRLVGIVTRKDILRKPDEEQLALLMTPDPVTVQHDDSLRDVVDILANSNFRRLPVLKEDKLVGIITLRDIINQIAEMEIEDAVKRYVTNSTVCVWEETPLNVVGEVMRLTNAELCPVLDDNGSLVGLIDEKIMLSESLIDEFLEEKSYASSSDSEDYWMWDSFRDFTVKYFEVSVVKLPKEPVKNFMKKAVYVYPQTKVSKCAREMIKNDIDHIPVADADERLIGMVHDRELIKVLLDIMQ